MEDYSNIAILFFSRRAEAESQHKKWFRRGQAGNLRLARNLIDQTRATLHRSGLPVLHWHEQNQRGKTFGERLSNAFEDAFACGFDAVICVGNDTPEIRSLSWQDIQTKLAENKPIIGGTRAGGAYCIALTKSMFDKETFQELPWQTPDLLDALQSQLEDCHLLPVFTDINTLIDLRYCLQIRKHQLTFLKWLFGINRPKNAYFQYLDWNIISFTPFQFSRPPPIAC